MITAGILSDTHISQITESFKDMANRAFSACDVILHAGDITTPEILGLFQGKTVHAVHGNMCDLQARQLFPVSKTIELEGHRLGLCHGAGPRHTIEERMWALFPEADCIIYGHTHQPVCHRHGGILFINPGSFQCHSAHGSPAHYAILQISEERLEAKLHTISL